MMQQLPDLQDLERRYRAYREDAKPIIDAMVQIKALSMPERVLILHADGTRQLHVIEPEYPPPTAAFLKWCEATLAALRVSYRLDPPAQQPTT